MEETSSLKDKMLVKISPGINNFKTQKIVIPHPQYMQHGRLSRTAKTNKDITGHD